MGGPFGQGAKNPYFNNNQFNSQVGATGSAGTNFNLPSTPTLLGAMSMNQIRSSANVNQYGAINVNPMGVANASYPSSNSPYNTSLTSGVGGGFQSTYASSVAPTMGQNVASGVNAVGGAANLLSSTGYTAGSFMSKVASSGFGKAMGNMSQLATKAMPIIALGAAIGGIIASRRAKKREAARKKKEKKFALQTQDRLVGAAGRVGEDVSTQAQFQRDAFALQGEASAAQYAGSMDKAQAALGSTNLAGSGSGQEMISDMREGFQTNARQRELAFAGDRYKLGQQYDSRIRDIESSLLGLQQTAGQRGYSLGSVSVLDRLNRGIG